MGMADFLALEDAALVRELVVKQHALVEARFAHSMNRLDNTASLRGIRKDIARIKMEIGRRETAAGLKKDDLVRTHRVDPTSLNKGEDAGSTGGFLAGVVDKLGE